MPLAEGHRGSVVQGGDGLRTQAALFHHNHQPSAPQPDPLPLVVNPEILSPSNPQTVYPPKSVLGSTTQEYHTLPPQSQSLDHLRMPIPATCPRHPRRPIHQHKLPNPPSAAVRLQIAPSNARRQACCNQRHTPLWRRGLQGLYQVVDVSCQTRHPQASACALSWSWWGQVRDVRWSKSRLAGFFCCFSWKEVRVGRGS